MLILSLQWQFSPLSLLTVVLFGFVWPLAYISAGGLYTEAERAAVIRPLGAGMFFPLSAANSPKRGKTKFPWRCNAVYNQQLQTKKFWEISGNHNWHCYFEGLIAYIITLKILLSPPQKTWLVVVLYCTLWILDSSQKHILLPAFCLQAKNTIAHQSFHWLSQPCSLQCFYSENPTWRRLKI